MEKAFESPYLKDKNRLAYVISAIQAMAVNKRYKLSFKEWAEKISGDENKEKDWEIIFKQHPEFFRINSEDNKASLVWRRSKQRTFQFDDNIELTRNEAKKLSEKEQNEKLSRYPLTGTEISALITTAIELHNRALENRKEDRWWYTPVVGIGGSLFGVVLGFILNWVL